jgi:hypothetical protein
MGTNIQVPPSKLAGNSNKYTFSSLSMFHLNRVVNAMDEMSSEEHLKNLRMGTLSSALEKADSQWEQIFKCRLSWQGTPIKIISLSMFHLNRVVNAMDEMSSEEH